MVSIFVPIYISYFCPRVVILWFHTISLRNGNLGAGYKPSSLRGLRHLDKNQLWTPRNSLKLTAKGNPKMAGWLEVGLEVGWKFPFGIFYIFRGCPFAVGF